MSKALIEQLRAQRTGRVEVEPGKFLLVRRPLEVTEMWRFFIGENTQELFIKHVVGWDGVTQADLLGPAVGASDPAVFSRELADETLADKAEWVTQAGAWLANAIKAHIEKRAAEAKN